MDTENDTAEAVGEPEEEGAEEVLEPTIEDLAREMGWNPDYEGENPKTAAEYIKATNDIKAHHARDLKALREEVARIAETNGRIVETTLEQRKKELDEEYRAKWEANDFQGANAVLEEKAKLQTQPKGAPQPLPEASKWASERSWYNTDPMATLTAENAAMAAARMGKSVAEQLDYADQQVKLHHPHLFAAPKKQPAVNGQSGRTPPAKKKGKTFADLPAEAREAAMGLIERGMTTKEGYAQHYFSDGGQ